MSLAATSEGKVAVWRQDRAAYDSNVDKTVVEALSALSLQDDFITPGDHVVLKPNWVKEHDERRPGPNQWEHVITHPSVISAVTNWVAERLADSGRITICDAPQTDSSFARLREYCDLDGLVQRAKQKWPGLNVQLLDLRIEEWHSIDGVTVSKKELPGDPMGATTIPLNEASEFVGFHGLGRLYGASYDMHETNAHHMGTKHEYQLCRTPLAADVLINLPKLKCHKKVGLTCALKNLVGINASKNWLPHHTEGTPDQGGDQFPATTAKAKLEHSWMGRIKRFLSRHPQLSKAFVPIKRLGRFAFGDTEKTVRSGNWHGNDTCWRMVLDLNKCVFNFDANGLPRERPLKYLCVVDAIVAGEGNGPMSPDPKACGMIISGTNPVAVDAACCALMGFDWRKLRMLVGAFRIRNMPLIPVDRDSISVVSNIPSLNKSLGDYRRKDSLGFKPHFGWVGAIEINN
ncbi:MAG: DUF362 domain-containing protein [Verrucomicrobiaceae bacterium]|nr:DUF362 domain-containing protein [Verrucomicrobiaceae bacterium]